MSQESERPKNLYLLSAILSYAKSRINLQKNNKNELKQDKTDISGYPFILHPQNRNPIFTYNGTNWRKKARWGKGKSMYSIIFNTASDLM